MQRSSYKTINNQYQSRWERRLSVARGVVGPIHISGRLLKTFASRLCHIYCRIFNWSLKDCSIPGAWKSSTICPVPKKKSPSTLNNYRLVALTSLVMKCFEKIVLQHLLTFTSQPLDPFQFAYKSHRGSAWL